MRAFRFAPLVPPVVSMGFFPAAMEFWPCGQGLIPSSRMGGLKCSFVLPKTWPGGAWWGAACRLKCGALQYSKRVRCCCAVSLDLLGIKRFLGVGPLAHTSRYGCQGRVRVSVLLKLRGNYVAYFGKTQGLGFVTQMDRLANL
eukprot:2611746-Amphidinium_carterae.1